MNYIPLDLAKLIAIYTVKPITSPYSWLPMSKMDIVQDLTVSQYRLLISNTKKNIPGPGNDIWTDLLTDPDKINILKETIETIKMKLKLTQIDPGLANAIKTYQKITTGFVAGHHHLIDPKPHNDKILNKTKKIYHILNSTGSGKCVLL